MAQNSISQPTYTHAPPSKANRLYQQLLSSNYLHDHIFQSQTPPTQPALIKFSSHHPKPHKSSEPTSYQKATPWPAVQLLPLKINQTNNKSNNQITQSLGSNYSIIEMDNESYSTLNLYSLSRHHIEPDLSMSSNHLTEKMIREGLTHHEETYQQMLKQSSNQQTITQDNYHPEPPDKMKKYRSEEFPFPCLPVQEQEEEKEEMSPLPKLLAEKYIKNEINKKFSSSQTSEQQETNFKTILNEVYVVPYKINQEVQSYAFSLPIDPSNDPHKSKQERKGKANSLNLHHSVQTEINDEEKESNQLYFSSHTHRINNRAPAQLTTHNSPQYSEYRQQRPFPKSQPKDHHLSNQKTTRSNSIGYKNKPSLVGVKADKQGQHPIDRLDHSRITKIYKQEEQVNEQNKIAFESPSVIYDEKEVSLCCGLNCHEKPQANKINFSNKSGALFCDEVPLTPQTAPSKRITSYKISPLSIIKGKQSQAQKKGLKLVGFNSSFQRKSSE